MVMLYILLFLLALYSLYIVFLFVVSLFVKNKDYEKESKFYRFLLDSSTKRVLKFLRIRVHTEGIDSIPEGKLLFVENHRSNYDPIITWYVFKKYHLAFLSKKENFSIPIFGRFIRACCFMAIDRKNIRNAVPTIVKASELLKNDEVSIAVYPEGTRSKECTLLPFHNCMFKIAQMAEKPIVVLTIEGTEKIFRNIKRLKPSDVYLKVVDVIPTERVIALRSCELSDEIRNKMEENLRG